MTIQLNELQSVCQHSDQLDSTPETIISCLKLQLEPLEQEDNSPSLITETNVELHEGKVLGFYF